MAGNEVADLYTRSAAEPPRARQVDREGQMRVAFLKRRRTEKTVEQWWGGICSGEKWQQQGVPGTREGHGDE